MSRTQWILALDANCGKCSDLGKEIQAIAGERLTVGNLWDPQVREWRQQAGATPHEPTLISVRGNHIQAWVWSDWKRFGLQLTKAVGLRRTQRILRLVMQEKALPPQLNAVSRRRSLQMVGATAFVALAAGLGTSKAYGSGHQRARSFVGLSPEEAERAYNIVMFSNTWRYSQRKARSVNLQLESKQTKLEVLELPSVGNTVYTDHKKKTAVFLKTEVQGHRIAAVMVGATGDERHQGGYMHALVDLATGVASGVYVVHDALADETRVHSPSGHFSHFKGKNLQEEGEEGEGHNWTPPATAKAGRTEDVAYTIPQTRAATKPPTTDQVCLGTWLCFATQTLSCGLECGLIGIITIVGGVVCGFVCSAVYTYICAYACSGGGAGGD